MSQNEKPFSSQIETEPVTQWALIHLKYNDINSNKNISATILPQAGSNICSIKLGLEELLLQPPTIQKLMAFHYGSPILYPTPNRVRNSQFTFQKETYRFIPNWKPSRMGYMIFKNLLP